MLSKELSLWGNSSSPSHDKSDENKRVIWSRLEEGEERGYTSRTYHAFITERLDREGNIFKYKIRILLYV